MVIIIHCSIIKMPNASYGRIRTHIDLPDTDKVMASFGFKS